MLFTLPHSSRENYTFWDFQQGKEPSISLTYVLNTSLKRQSFFFMDFFETTKLLVITYIFILQKF